MKELCRVSIEELDYQLWMDKTIQEENWDEEAAMEQYYGEKYGED